MPCVDEIKFKKIDDFTKSLLCELQQLQSFHPIYVNIQKHLPEPRKKIVILYGDNTFQLYYLLKDEYCEYYYFRFVKSNRDDSSDYIGNFFVLSLNKIDDQLFWTMVDHIKIKELFKKYDNEIINKYVITDVDIILNEDVYTLEEPKIQIFM